MFLNVTKSGLDAAFFYYVFYISYLIKSSISRVSLSRSLIWLNGTGAVLVREY